MTEYKIRNDDLLTIIDALTIGAAYYKTSAHLAKNTQNWEICVAQLRTMEDATQALRELIRDSRTAEYVIKGVRKCDTP